MRTTLVVAVVAVVVPTLAHGQADIESNFQGLLEASRAEVAFVIISIEQPLDSECAAPRIAPLDAEARRVLRQFGHNVQELSELTEANGESSFALRMNFAWAGVAPACVGIADFELILPRRWLGSGTEDMILMPTEEDPIRVRRLLPYMLQMLPRGEVRAAHGRAFWISPTADRFQRAGLSAVTLYVTAIASRMQAVER